MKVASVSRRSLLRPALKEEMTGWLFAMPWIIGFLLFTSSACLLTGIYPVKVEGDTMAPALNDGDKILIEREPEKLERGDIVVFLSHDPVKSYIKRIVGLPNETVEIREGKVFVNGQHLPEPYVDPELDQEKEWVMAREKRN